MDDERMTEQERTAARVSDPDPMGLLDVIELIAPEARVTGWSPLAGGVGHATHRIEVTMPSGNEIAFVLRRYLPGGGGSTPLHDASTLEALRGTPVATAEMLWADPDGTVFDRPALATTLLPGRHRSAEVHDDPTILRGLAEALVSLRWARDLDAFGHLPRLEDAPALLAWVRDADPLPDVPFADTRAVVDTLVAGLADLAPTTVGLCHGDFHVGNVLFDDAGGHTGIVDWDHARLTDPRTDLAYAAMDLSLVAGMDVADAFLAEHEALAGPFADRAWWCLRASADMWDDLDEWLPGWTEVGIALDVATVHERAGAWTDRWLAELVAGRGAG